MGDDVLAGYAADVTTLIAPYDAISSARVYRSVADLLPATPSRIADIGAATGRDAAWLAATGHHVTAVEPVAAFREAGMTLHPSPRIDWLDDRLPQLSALRRRTSFDYVLLSAVWQHLDDELRSIAMIRLAEVTAPGGLLLLSLRHGAGAAGRPVYPVQPDDTVNAAIGAGFELVRKCQAESVQPGNRAAGVHWTWLALRLR